MANSGSRLNALLSFVLMIGNALRLVCGECNCNSNAIEDNVYEGSHRILYCCIDDVLGFNDADATINWSFKGETIREEKDVKKISNCEQTLELIKPKLSDGGIYTCVVTSSNGTEGTKDIRLNVHEKKKHRQKPSNVEAPDNGVCAQVGEPASISCSGNYGKVTWMVWKNGFDFLSSDIKEVKEFDETGEHLNSTLIFSAVKEEHFGDYICKFSNTNDKAVLKNITLKDSSVSPDCHGRKIPIWTVIVAACFAFFFLAIPCLCCRFRTALRVMYMEVTKGNHVKDDFVRDVFVVHGEKATPWVQNVLVSTLEDTYGYQCYFPDRDMLGGEQKAEAIAQEMSKSRRVLVVVTPCLLQSQWASWSAYHGIATCFKSSRIRGLLLKEMESDAVSSGTSLFIKTLRPIELLKVPKRCQSIPSGCKTSSASQTKDLPPTTGMECMRKIFLGNPETLFWQKVRLFLNLPATNCKNNNESIV